MEDIEDLILTQQVPVKRLESNLVVPSLAQTKLRLHRLSKYDGIKSLADSIIEGGVQANGSTLMPETATTLLDESQEGDDLIDFTQFSQDLIQPGFAKIYVKTWGCAHNSSDSEYMAGLLVEYGYDVTYDELEAQTAQLWLLNSCTVKGPAEAHFINAIEKAKSLGKHVVIAGCVPQAWGLGESGRKATNAANATQISIIGVQQIDRVVEVVEETLKGNNVQILGLKFEDDHSTSLKKKSGGAALNLPKIRRNQLVEIVPISTGCLNECTYCKTKHARGHLGSYHVEVILDRIKTVISEGVLEIWLTSEDTGAYGRDIGTNITVLLWSILEILPEPVMLRMGMTNPPYILEHLDEMVKIYKHPRIYQYLHLPIQSASDSVLTIMRREYLSKDFEYLVDNLLAQVPQLNIATDLIIGFPGETDDDFEQTWNLVQKYKFKILFINQFYPRPGTPAARMKRVSTQIVKQRTKKLSNWFKTYMPYEGRIGEHHSILVTEIAPDGQHYAGRTRTYEMVLVEANPRFMKRMIQVEIVETGKFYLKGQVIESCLATLESQQTPSLLVLPYKRNSIHADSNVKSLEQSGQSRLRPYQIKISMANQRGQEKLDYHQGDDDDDDTDQTTPLPLSQPMIAKIREKLNKLSPKDEQEAVEIRDEIHPASVLIKDVVSSNPQPNTMQLSNTTTLSLADANQGDTMAQFNQKSTNQIQSEWLYSYPFMFSLLAISISLLIYPFLKAYFFS